MSPLKMKQVADSETTDSTWNGLYRIAGVAALIAALAALSDIVISFLLGGGEIIVPGTLPAVEWFRIFEENRLLGLSDMGLINIITTSASVPVFFALWVAHRRVYGAYAALAAIFLFLGTAIYISNNVALPMLNLSGQYAAATTESQRSLLVSAGQAMLARSEDLTSGTFLGFLFVEAAGIGISFVMLRSGIFSRVTAVAGILGEGLLLIFSILAAFVPSMFDVAIMISAVGGLLALAWLILIARRLFQLGQGLTNAEASGN